MLSEKEKHEIDHEIEKTEYRRGASIDALLVVQRYRGYVSDEAIKDIAAYLEMSPAELDSIATFYNRIYRRPVGRNVIRVCDSVSCHIMGYQKMCGAMLRHLDVKMGSTTKDGAFTVITTQCLGTCDKAPAIMIGDNLHRDLDDKKIIEVVESYRDKHTQGEEA